jgi:hypothetical protein
MDKRGASQQVIWTIVVIVIFVVILLVALWAWKFGGLETIKSILGIADAYKGTTPPVIN